MKKTNLILFFFFLFGLVLDSCGKEKSTTPVQWKVGTSSGMFTNFSQEEFDKFKNTGIDCVELSGVFNGKSDEERESLCNAIKERAEKAGIEIWSIHLPFSAVLDLSLIDDEIRNNMIKECVKIINLCERLKPKKYVIHPSSEPIKDEDRPTRIKNSIASLKILNDVVKKQGAQLAVEDLPRTCLGNTHTELLEIVNAVGNGLGICFDSNHMLKENPEELVAAAGHLITTVHISDYDGIDERHWLPGKGIINWNNVISELVKSGYKGPFMFEVSSKNNPGITIKNLTDCWQKLKDNYSKSTDE